MQVRFTFVVFLLGSAACAAHPPRAAHDPLAAPRLERAEGPAARESAREEPAPATRAETPSGTRPTAADGAQPPKARDAMTPGSMNKAPPATEPAEIAPRGPVVPNSMPEPSPL
jgi:hypothetical protein